VTGRSPFYRRRLKRVFDVVVVLVSSPFWVPTAIGVAAAVLVALGRPVLFRQNRPGIRGQPFQLLKFRTMTEERNESGRTLSDRERLTRFGRFLRATSLDELPELINVVRGEMSLVGPRPLLVEYLDRYSAFQARRHEVVPGITGWAQVNGRNALTWDEKFDLDVWYVDNCGFLLDLRILAMTIFRVLARHGVSAAGEATMPEFLGPKGREG
jgi:lipopolysaccharide/colanic/teichoic acid biosynthesis glycosyltransferase